MISCHHPVRAYRDAHLLEDARQIRAAVKLPMILLGGPGRRGRVAGE
ncbi:hypothetical protein ACIOEW_28265 [Streptomyces sp. NPDC087901]